MKKNKLLILVIPVIIILSVLIVSTAFPKNLGRMPGFILLFIADVYLFLRTRKLYDNFSNRARLLLSTGHWLPAIAIAGVGVASLLIPYHEWNIPFRTYFTGIILILYIFKATTAGLIFHSDLLFYTWRFERMIFVLPYNEEITDKRRTLAIRISVITGGIILLVFLTGMFSVYNPVIKEKILVINDLPPSFSGKTIIHISDFHLGSWSSVSALESAVDKINSLNPDYLFFTGDLVNYSGREALGFKSVLLKLAAKDGIWCVNGNHDYGDYVRWKSKEDKDKDFAELMGFYQDLGWKVLMNEHEVIHSGTDSLAIVGVENWSDISRFPQKGRLDKALKGAETVAVKILLSHDPKHWEKVVKEYPVHIDLTLSGHTHGFQIGILSDHIRWSPAQWMYPQWGGWYHHSQPDDFKPRWLNVNVGLGSIGYPGRIGIRPEISLIRLERE